MSSSRLVGCRIGAPIRRLAAAISTPASDAAVCIIGLDSGTQSTKACAYDARGRQLASASVAQTVSTPADQCAEQDIRVWRSSLYAAITEAVQSIPGPPRRVAAIGLSFQRESFTLAEPASHTPPTSTVTGGSAAAMGPKSELKSACMQELKPLRPAILWLDGRAQGEVDLIMAGGTYGDTDSDTDRDICVGQSAQWQQPLSASQYHALTGKPLDATSAWARMRWLRAHEPAHFARDAASTGSSTRPRQRPPLWVDCGAVLSHALTGKRVTCVAGADTCGLVDLRLRSWAPDILAAAGLSRDQLPELAEPGTVVGGVTAAAAQAMEGTVEEGVPVVMAGGDGQVFHTGMTHGESDLSNGGGGDGSSGGGSEETKGARLTLTLGTSVVLSMDCDHLAVDTAFRTLASAGIRPRSADGDCNSSSTGDAQRSAYTLESVVQSGTLILKWFVTEFGHGVGTSGFEALEREATVLPTGSDGLVTVPHWWGCRFPDSRPSVRGATLGWSHHHTRAHLYRSVVEGLAFELRRAVLAMEAGATAAVGGAVAPTPSHVRVGGGGARSDLVCQTLADVLGRPVVVAKMGGDLVALGAAMHAAHAVGLAYARPKDNAAPRVFAPHTERHAHYLALYEGVYLPLLEHATSLSAEMQRIERSAKSSRD